MVTSLPQAHQTHVSTLSVQASARIRPVIRGDRWRVDHGAALSRCFSAAGIGFLGPPAPAEGLVPSSRSGYRDTNRCLDLDGVVALHTYEIRLGWLPPRPREQRCPTAAGRVPQPPLAASQRLGPCTPLLTTHPRSCHMTRHHQRFARVQQSSLPLHLWPPDGAGTLGLDPLSFAPRSYPRRTSGWGRTFGHWPGTTPSASILQSASSLATCALASHRSSSPSTPAAAGR